MDAIICITLENAHERHEHIKQMASILNLPIELHIAKRHPTSGIIGCFTSHIAVLKRAYDAGYNNVLILEDDFLPTVGYDPKKLEEVMDFMKTNKWYIFQFGSMPVIYPTLYNSLTDPIKFIFSEKISNSIYKWIGVGAHANAYSREAMKDIIDNSKIVKDIIHYDLWLNQLVDKINKRNECFCVIPMQFDQKWCFPTQNGINNNIYEKFFRRNQCFFENYSVFYRLSLICKNRHFIPIAIVLLIVITILIAYYLSKFN